VQKIGEFEHFIPGFNKISTLYGYPPKKGLGWKEAQREGDFTNIFCIYTYTPQNNYMGPCKCIWQIFTRPCVSVIYIYTLQQDKCKCKKFGHVSANDLHIIYMAIDTHAQLRSKPLCENATGVEWHLHHSGICNSTKSQSQITAVPFQVRHLSAE